MLGTVIPARGPHASRGLSLIELLIGLALSLFIVSTGLALLTSHLHENRSLILEARLMQDLRAASEAVARDLRRAGHWGDATAGLWHLDGTARANPYQAVAPAAGASDGARLRYSRDTVENHLLDANEEFGVRLRNQGIDILLGDNNWQALTDPGTLLVTGLRLTPHTSLIEQTAPCERSCPPAGPSTPACPPQLQVRRYTVEITAQLPLDTRVQRNVSTTVRVRNDAVIGQCPA